MKKLTVPSCATGLIAVVTFSASIHAAPPCFDNDTPFEAQLSGLEGGDKTTFITVKPGEKVCADEDVKTIAKIAFPADEPPYIGEVSVEPDQVVKVVKDSGGYFLVSLDAENNEVTRTKLAQPK